MRNNPFHWRMLGALGAGALLPLAFAPFNIGAITIVSLWILFYLWVGAEPRRAFWIGFWFGLGQFGVGISWVYVSLHDFGGANPLVSGLFTFAFVMVLALFPGFSGWLSARYARNGFSFNLVLFFPAAWILFEWVRSWVLTGFPWLHIGYSQTDTGMAGYIPLFGVFGAGGLTALCAVLLLAALKAAGWWRWSAIGTFALIWILGFSLQRLEWTEPVGKPFKATLLQGNVPQELKWRPEFRQLTLDMYVEMTRAHWDSDVIVWPETAVPVLYDQMEEAFFNPLGEEAKSHQTDLLIGVPLRDLSSNRYFNALVGIGRHHGFYRKHHLVPFGEYLPLQPVSGFIVDIFEFPMSDFSAGGENQILLKAGGYPLRATICYEDAFGQESLSGLPDAAYLVNITNDAWFGNSMSPHQHLQMARVRALETGRYMLRATNNGVTAIISPQGEILQSAPQFKSAQISGEITPMGGSTPYIQFGDIPPIAGVFAILLLAHYRESRKACA